MAGDWPRRLCGSCRRTLEQQKASFFGHGFMVCEQLGQVNTVIKGWETPINRREVKHQPPRRVRSVELLAVHLQQFRGVGRVRLEHGARSIVEAVKEENPLSIGHQIHRF